MQSRSTEDVEKIESLNSKLLGFENLVIFDKKIKSSIVAFQDNNKVKTVMFYKCNIRNCVLIHLLFKINEQFPRNFQILGHIACDLNLSLLWI